MGRLPWLIRSALVRRLRRSALHDGQQLIAAGEGARGGVGVDHGDHLALPGLALVGELRRADDVAEAHALARRISIYRA